MISNNYIVLLSSLYNAPGIRTVSQQNKLSYFSNSNGSTQVYNENGMRCGGYFRTTLVTPYCETIIGTVSNRLNKWSTIPPKKIKNIYKRSFLRVASFLSRHQLKPVIQKLKISGLRIVSAVEILKTAVSCAVVVGYIGIIRTFPSFVTEIQNILCEG